MSNKKETTALTRLIAEIISEEVKAGKYAFALAYRQNITCKDRNGQYSQEVGNVGDVLYSESAYAGKRDNVILTFTPSLDSSLIRGPKIPRSVEVGLDKIESVFGSEAVSALNDILIRNSDRIAALSKQQEEIDRANQEKQEALDQQDREATAEVYGTW